jgi:hypothetical protein
MNLRMRRKAMNSFKNLATITFSGRTVLHGVSVRLYLCCSVTAANLLFSLASDLYPEGSRFTSRTGNQLSWLKMLVVFLNASK